MVTVSGAGAARENGQGTGKLWLVRAADQGLSPSSAIYWLVTLDKFSLFLHMSPSM